MTLLGEVFWETLDLGALYTHRPYVFDSVLYLVLFLGIARVTLGRRFEGRGGAAITASVGVALAVAATVTAQQSGFALVSIGPIAWAAFLLILGLLLYDLARHAHCPRWPAIGVVLILLSVIGSSIGRSVEPLLVAIGLVGGLATLGAIGLLVLAGWGLSRIAGSQHREYRDRDHGKFDRGPPDRPIPGPYEPDPGGTITGETDIARLLEQLLRHLRSHQIDAHAQGLLTAIARRRRALDTIYEQMLAALARAGWKNAPDRLHLADGVKTILRAVRQNSVRFDGALRVALAAMREGNEPLLRQAARRMLRLEREAIRLARDLDGLIEKMRSVRAEAPNRGRR